MEDFPPASLTDELRHQGPYPISHSYIHSAVKVALYLLLLQPNLLIPLTPPPLTNTRNHIRIP